MTLIHVEIRRAAARAAAAGDWHNAWVDNMEKQRD